MRPHLALAALLLVPPLNAQQQVTLGEIATHRLLHPSPVLPQAARDAMVDGTVDLRITVDASGNVTGAQAVDGPELLRDTAAATVRRWTFRPFRNAQGKPAVASGMVEMSFTLPPEDAQRRSAVRKLDDQTQAKFFPLQDKCHADVRAGVASAASTACLDAAALAPQFDPQQRFIERRGAYVFAAIWFLQNQDGEHALPYAQLAVQEVQKGHDDDSGSNAAYTVRGEAEALLGQLQRADDDLRIAEDLVRKAIARAATSGDSFVVTREYTPALRRNLRVRAGVLTRLGQVSAAEQQRDELLRLGGK